MKEWIVLHKIKALYNNGSGLSQRQIARELGISRNSVHKYLQQTASEISEQREEVERAKVLDEYKGYIVHLLHSYPALSAVKVLRKLKEKHSGILISARTVRRYVERLRETVNCKQRRYYQPVLDMVPGAQCQVDPGELRDVMIGGVETTVYFVVFVLSYSRLMYVGLSAQPINTAILIQLHDAAFRYFGGCVEECVYDQTKMVVLREEYRELVLNQRFHEYATYAGFTMRVCEGYDPESKGKVEAGVKYVKQNGLYAEHFASWSELQAYTMDWLDTIANCRCHGTTGEAPRYRYEIGEKAHMLAYNTPAVVQQEGQQGMTRKVDKTGLISWCSNKYSVPQAYQGGKVQIAEQAHELIIYDTANCQEIARHPVSSGRGKVIQNRHHYRDLAQVQSELEAKLIEQLGEAVGSRLGILLKNTSPKIYKDQLRGVLDILAALGAAPEPEILARLCAREQLTATMFRDYLKAYQGRKSQERTKPEKSCSESTASLESYKKVLTRCGGHHAIH